MADIRINAIATTATDFASDDYIAIDGTANGTRKVNAKTANLTFGDVTLGTSGPSAKSSIAARAARQGLVFDGTTGAPINIAGLGTRFTIHFWANPATSGSDLGLLNASNSPYSGNTLIDAASGRFGIYNGSSYVYTTSSRTVGKLDAWTYVLSNGTGTWYKNGVQDYTGSDAGTYTATISGFGSEVNGTKFNGFLSGLIYNRALSAAEVVSLWETGVPSGADYNSASNTLLNTSTALNTFSTAFATFTGASATGFTGSDTTASKSPRVIFPLSGTLVAGRRYRAKFTATLTAMSAVQIYQSDSSYTGISSIGYVSSGANEFTFTATSSVNAIMLLCTTDGSVGTHSVVISDMAVDTPGLLLAPDAAQAGGGLTWYDTSGNSANITLPASGVTWNVPTSAKTASGWSFGGNVGIGTTTPQGNLDVVSASNPTLNIATAGNVSTAKLVLLQYASGGYGRVQAYDYASGAKPLVLNDLGGNLLIGTTTDAGQKLQVAGTIAATTGAANNALVARYNSSNSLFGVTVNSAGQGVVSENNDASTGSDKYSKTGLPAFRLGNTGGSGTVPFWVDVAASGTAGNAITWTNAFQIDNSANATFAGKITATGISGINALAAGTQLATFESSVNGAAVELITKGKNSTGTARAAYIGLNRFADDVLSISDGTTERLRLGLTNGNLTVTGALKLGNAYTAGVVVTTGYVTIQDSSGTTYKIPVGT